MKLMSCVIILTTLIVGNRAAEKYLENPRVLTGATTPKITPPNPQPTVTQTADPKTTSQNRNVQGTNGQPTTTNKPIKNSISEKYQSPNPDAEYIPSRNITNVGKGATSLDNSTAENAALKSISIHEEKNSFSSSVWIYITLGVLCVAVFNVYIFWYRRRAATYSFQPTGTSQR